MKKIVGMFISVAILVSLAACGMAEETTVIPPEGYEVLYQKHMIPLHVAMIISTSWTDANVIDSDNFLYYYASAFLQSGGSFYGYDTDDMYGVLIPADEVEPFVQDHFNVTVEHLRTGEYYDADKNVYMFGGLGSASDSVVTSAEQTGKLMSIWYDTIGAVGYLYAQGVVTIEVNGDDYKYISNENETSAQYYLAYPTATDFTDTNGVFMMDSSTSGASSIGPDDIIREYIGNELTDIISFYETEALIVLEAQGAADPAKHEDGWFWSGTYRGGKPLTIEVRRNPGADSYIIAATYAENAGTPDWDIYNTIEEATVNDDSEFSIMAEMDRLYAQLNREKLPLSKEIAWLENDPERLASLPKQLIIDTPEAYEYALLIRNYLFIGRNVLEDFDDVSSMPFTGVIETALYHTTPIEGRWAWYGGRENGYEGPFDDHVLSAFVKNEAEQGRGPSDIYYVDDVVNTLYRMFGKDVDLYHRSAEPYIYYARDRVYTRIGDFGGGWVGYPMLTAMEPTQNGMVCEVVIADALDNETPTKAFDVDLTRENFYDATHNLPLYRYTFEKAENDSLILKSLVTVRSGAQ